MNAGKDTNTGTVQPEDDVHAAGSGPQVRLVSNVVYSFAWVRGGPPGPIRYGPTRSRTVVNPGERGPALLESVLGASAGYTGFAATNCQVAGIANGPEQGATRRRSVRPTVGAATADPATLPPKGHLVP